MLKGLSAIVLAGVSAGFIVGFVSEPERAVAAATPGAKLSNAQSNGATAKALLIAATATCTQTWPYYEQSCLRDNRRSGEAPAARVISLNDPAKSAVKTPIKAPVSKVAKLAGGTR
jgi:hypothetical protein